MSAPHVFDRRLILRHRQRAIALGAATFLLDRVAEDMADRLAATLRSFSRGIDLATPGDAIRRALAGHPRLGTLIGVDALAASAEPAGVAVVADTEILPFADASLDLVVSGLALQAVDDLPGTFAQVRRALRPDGLFLAALLGGATLTELRQSFALAETECEVRA